MIDQILKLCEQDAITKFGEEKIGTKEKRIALPDEDKRQLLEYLVKQFYTRISQHGVFIRFF